MPASRSWLDWANLRDDVADAVKTPDEIPPAVPAEQAEVARDTLAGANEAAAQLPGDLGGALLAAANDAFAAGFQISAVTGTVVLAELAIVVAALVRHVRPAPAVEVETEAAGVPVPVS